ncbi:MAG: hypothetical protein ACPGYL_02400 [Rhodospirillaceae bacterium]
MAKGSKKDDMDDMEAGGGGSKGGGLGALTQLGLLLIAAPMVLFFIPTVVLLSACLLPSVVAAFTDRSVSRTGWICVGGLNFAASIPFIAELWRVGHTIESALTIVTDILTIIVVYSGAGVGWLLYMSVPQILATFMAATAGHRIQSLRKQEERLVAEWGEAVRVEYTLPGAKEELDKRAAAMAASAQNTQS